MKKDGHVIVPGPSSAEAVSAESRIAAAKETVPVKVAIVIEPEWIRASLLRGVKRQEGIEAIDGESSDAEVVVASEEATLRQALTDGKFVIQIIRDDSHTPLADLQKAFPGHFGCCWIFPSVIPDIVRLVRSFKGEVVDVRSHSLHPPIISSGL